ncbi:ABC transporter substrate-binding protein [Alicyclobacillus ferrooxydans]|uniref:ABC transporter substrate-binding protein n=1 Tax=Alicyclobacillus ferrooxydans TaxID=471514 RepID=A0A0P9CFS7_9BACL|nr:sugar ABC transporter substrate-binding protein [Alicyclobacillus ferrooxydans]KPV44423.1 hypothetical protein AN477_07325 [Alicyclobacillus ferrooxydans]
MKSKFKKIGIAGIGVLGITALLAGCGSGGSNGSSGGSGGSGSSNTANSNSGPTSQPVTLKVMGWNIAEGTLVSDEALFKKIHPNVSFNNVTVDSPPNTYTKYNAELAAGADVPDVMIVETSQAGSFLKKFPNSFLDLTSYMTPMKSDFAAAKWPALTMNGKIYGIPWDIGPALVFYRTDLFKQAGINPSSIKTWNDYIAAGQKLTQHFGGKVKMTTGSYANDGMFKLLMNEQGSYYFNQSGDITLTTPAAQTAVSIEKKMWDSGILMHVPSATGWNDTIKAFVNNQIASAIMGIWYVGTIEGSAPSQSGKWAVMPLPAVSAGGNTAANSGGSNLMISAHTQHPKTAEEFAQFCMTNSQALDISMKNGIYPSYLPYLKNSPLISQAQPFFGGQKVFQIASNEVPNITPANHTSDFTVAENYVDTALGQIFTNKSSISQGLSSAANKLAQETGRKISSQ